MKQYTTLDILSFDRVAFAHSLSATNYKYALKNQGYSIYGETPENGGVLEIGFVEENPLYLTTCLGEVFIPENCIFVIPPHCSFSVRAQTEGIHRHTTAEFLIRCRCYPTDNFRPSKGQTVTLPLVIKPSPDSGEVFQLIRNIVCAKNAQLTRSYFEECASFMMLIHKLCILAQNVDSSIVSPSNQRYCDLAKAYISENIHRRVTIGEIAEAVGVSKNYLTNLFSKNEGLSPIEYVNRRKLLYMVELIRRYGYTLAEAGEHVGYLDVNYISRIFKRYYGVTVTEYKQNLSNWEETT